MPREPESFVPTGTDSVDQNPSAAVENARGSAGLPAKKTTAELLQDLIGLIKAAQTPPKKPETWVERLKVFNDWIKSNWLWGPILAFLVAWGFYQFNPLYPFAQFKIASDEARGKLQQLEYREKIVGHYIKQGDLFLNDGEFKEAARTYASAKAIDKNNLLAEYGLLKSRLLDVSVAKQFDPSVIARRLEMVKKLQPEGLSGRDDPHILYVEALLDLDTGKDHKAVESKLDRVIALDENHAPAYALRAKLARSSGDLEAAIADHERARTLMPFNGEYINNLAYTYQLRADQRFDQGNAEKAQSDLEKGFKLYAKTLKLDAEALAPQIEILRLKTLYALRFDEVNDEIPNLIRRVTSDALHELEKNKGDLSYQVQSDQKKGRPLEFKIRSWKAKQAYLQQLRLMSKWLGGLDRTLTAKDLDPQLKGLWNVSVDAKLNLPSFLLNDLHSLHRYKARWGALKSIPEQKIAHLTTLAEAGIQR